MIAYNTIHELTFQIEMYSFEWYSIKWPHVRGGDFMERSVHAILFGCQNLLIKVNCNIENKETICLIFGAWKDRVLRLRRLIMILNVRCIYKVSITAEQNSCKQVK